MRQLIKTIFRSEQIFRRTRINTNKIRYKTKVKYNIFRYERQIKYKDNLNKNDDQHKTIFSDKLNKKTLKYEQYLNTKNDIYRN